ncbi:MAG: glycosyltransferase family 4 protein [Bacteroidales bacterium]
MNISYISSFDATDINSYSGTGYFIPQMLQKTGDHVSFIGNLSHINPVIQKVKRKAYRALGKKYLIERNPQVLKLWAEQVNKKMDPATQVLTGYSSQPFARLHNNKPKVFWTDAVFADMIDYYEVYSNLCQESIADGNRMEHDAIHNATVSVYSSEWAARGAVKHYGIEESRVRVVPYGANISVNYSHQDIVERARRKSFDVCNLLFLGVEWYRKGGDVAVRIAEDLNAKGIPTTLSIVGVEPPEHIRNLSFIRAHGYISKSNPSGRDLLNRLITQSHFLLLPTRADCTPIVYSEMNAHGVPVITTDEGGIPSLIQQGINGYMFNKDSEIEVFSDCILKLFEDKNRYAELSASSFNEYKTRLNWDHSIRQFRAILQEVT